LGKLLDPTSRISRARTILARNRDEVPVFVFSDDEHDACG
jgi:hypothetical protein